MPKRDSNPRSHRPCHQGLRFRTLGHWDRIKTSHTLKLPITKQNFHFPRLTKPTDSEQISVKLIQSF
jgi:hypothetical protein